jgi:hypothetical protein
MLQTHPIASKRNPLGTRVTLLEQIQNESVDGSWDLATVLRKCRVLAAKLKNDPFEDWVIHELEGYFNAALPEYRILHGQCYGTFSGGWQYGATKAGDRRLFPAALNVAAAIT